MPEKPLGTFVWFAVNVTVLDMDGWPCTVALKIMNAVSTPVTWLQSTLKKTRCSGALGEIEPCGGEMLNQETLLVATNVNGVGPPAEISTNRFPAGTNGSSDMEGSGQP